MRRIFLHQLVFLGCLAQSISFSAKAQDEADAETQPLEKETMSSESEEPATSSPALTAFEEAKQLYNAGKYAEAALKFREANKLRPSWKIWFNIGQSEASAKRNGLALEAFERYVNLGGDEVPTDRKTMVLGEIARLQPVVGFVEVAAPEGARLKIDEVSRGTIPLPGPLMVAAAVEHEVIVVYGSETILDRKVMVGGGRTIKISATAPNLSGETDGLGETQPPPPPQAPTKSKLVPAGWALLGVGVATLAAGAGTGIAALSRSDELDNRCPGNKCSTPDDIEFRDSVDHLAVATDVLLAVGGTAAVTGLVLAIVGKKKNKSAGASFLHVTPYMGRSTGGLFIEGSF